MKGKIFVTGASGNVGREVVRYLLKRGQDVIASCRSVVDTKNQH